MPEYLAPGVFVEEVSYRSKSIEGVPTSTTGFAGLTRFGPVAYLNGPKASEPRLVTSYAEFERVYGGLTPLQLSTGTQLPYLAHSARAFFLNGGRRLYVSRIFGEGGGTPTPAEQRIAIVNSTAGGQPTQARFAARWPGAAGNVAVTVTAKRGGDVGLHRAGGDLASGAADHGTIVEVVPAPAPPAGGGPAQPPAVPAADAQLNLARLRVLHKAANGAQTFVDSTGTPAPPGLGDLLLPITLNVLVTGSEDRLDSYPRLGVADESRSAITRVLSWDDPADDDCMVVFEYPSTPALAANQPPPVRQQLPLPALPGQPLPAAMGKYIDLLIGLVGSAGKPERVYRLASGSDGALPSLAEFLGREADPDDVDKKATGLEALAEVDDIAIVAMPDAGAIKNDADLRFSVTQGLVAHAEKCRYRIAVVDGPVSASLNEIRSFRGNFDTKYAALYHPWIEVLDPSGPAAPGVPTQRLMLPPSGFVSGIYARNDITRGVYKAPANEVVYGLTRFEMNINQGRNEVLNPEHINALRFFPGRGNRVWGARTLSSDPEWMYVNVRRLFIYLEHSIDKATQWAVFEPNGEVLWGLVTRMVEDFLEVQWRNGALLGATPEEAFFVLCDRSTMTQNDLDNGRLICLIGVAPVKPAEFVIFRIGQWTLEAQG